MARIDSYSTGTLKLSDYLIGTDVSTENVTRSMPVSDIVSTILAAKSIGTATSISTSNSTFVSLAGGPITITGTLTPSLSASGTASSATFLRGDGTWSEPGPTPTDITTSSNSTVLTTDTSSWDFTGTGVTASSINDNVNVEIPGLLASVESIINATGITATGTVTTNPSTGDVTIVNSGVYQARAGGNVTLTGSATPLEFSSAVTVNTTANAGKIIGIDPGVGINIINNVTNPDINIDYAGLDNYIISNIDTVSSADVIAFQDLSVSEVKTAKLNTIPTSALTSLITTVDSGDNGKISNLESPAYTDVWKAKEIVTLTISEYNTIPIKDKNTLYVIMGAGTTYTATLNPTYNVTGGALNVGYTTLQEVNDGTGWVTASSLIAIAGTTYTFRITLTLLPGYTLSSGALTTSTSLLTMPANNTTDSLTITAVLTPPPGGNCVVELQIYNNTLGSGGGTGAWPLFPANWYKSFGDNTGDTVTVPQGSQYNFNTIVIASAPYFFTNSGGTALGNPTYSGFTGTAPNSPTYTAGGNVEGYLNILQTYTATWTPTIGTFTGSGAAYKAYIPITPNGYTSSGHPAGGSYVFLAPAVTQNNITVPGGTLTVTSYAWKEASTPVFVGGAAYYGTIPSPTGANVTHAFELTGNATFTANIPLQFRKLIATTQMNTAMGAYPGLYTLLNDVQGPINGSSGPYTYAPLPTIVPNSGYILTGGVVTLAANPITYNLTPGSSGAGTSGDPLIENFPSVSGATLTASLITIKMTTSIGTGYPTTYDVTFQNVGTGASRNLAVSGSNTTSNPSFPLDGSEVIVTITKQTNSTIAQGNGDIIWELCNPGCTGVGSTQYFYTAGSVAYSRTVSGVANGNTIQVNIVEG